MVVLILLNACASNTKHQPIQCAAPVAIKKCLIDVIDNPKVSMCAVNNLMRLYEQNEMIEEISEKAIVNETEWGDFSWIWDIIMAPFSWIGAWFK